MDWATKNLKIRKASCPGAWSTRPQKMFQSQTLIFIVLIFRMTAEANKSKGKKEKLHQELGPEVFEAWTEEHAADVLPSYM
jgi:hypothetical protein